MIVLIIGDFLAWRKRFIANLGPNPIFTLRELFQIYKHNNKNVSLKGIIMYGLMFCMIYTGVMFLFNIPIIIRALS